jgi:hypothetical protein
MQGKKQKLYPVGTKRNMNKIRVSSISFKIDILEMKYENFMKGYVILRESSNQEPRHVGIRLGI